MNSSPWRLEGVDGGDEQYLVESRSAVCHTPPDEQDPISNVAGVTTGFSRYKFPEKTIVLISPRITVS